MAGSSGFELFFDFFVFCVFWILRISPNKTQKQTQRNTQGGNQTNPGFVFLFFLFFRFFDYFLFFFWVFNLILFSFDFLVWFIFIFLVLKKSLISAFWEEFPLIMLVGGSTSPSEKYARQIGSFPHIGMNIEIFELPLPSLCRVCWWPPFLGSKGISKEAERIPEVFEKNLGKERVAPVSEGQQKSFIPQQQ